MIRLLTSVILSLKNYLSPLPERISSPKLRVCKKRYGLLSSLLDPLDRWTHEPFTYSPQAAVSDTELSTRPSKRYVSFLLILIHEAHLAHMASLLATSPARFKLLMQALVRFRTMVQQILPKAKARQRLFPRSLVSLRIKRVLQVTRPRRYASHNLIVTILNSSNLLADCRGEEATP